MGMTPQEAVERWYERREEARRMEAQAMQVLRNPRCGPEQRTRIAEHILATNTHLRAMQCMIAGYLEAEGLKDKAKQLALEEL